MKVEFAFGLVAYKPILFSKPTQLNYVEVVVKLGLQQLFQGNYSQGNTSSAACFNTEEAAATQFLLSQDFDAFEDDCSDGLCVDIDGN